MANSQIDVVGLGLNATDTVILVRDFPALGGKERLVSQSRQAGGQIATALVTCRRLGLRCRYIGKVGDDDAGQFQLRTLEEEGLDIQHVKVSKSTPNQLAYIVVDQATGERTVFWDRDPRLAVKPSEITRESLSGSRALHLDGCDVDACLTAARWARDMGIPVAADLDTVYREVEKLFPFIDYLIASANFLPSATGEADPFRVLEYMAKEYKMRMAGMTLGRDGALVYHDARFVYSPGFVVETVDTTGAGDVFHGAFLYGLLQAWPMGRILDFSNAMAGLNCTELGARGGIGTEAAAQKLVENGIRHVNKDYIRAAQGSVKTPASGF
ncbi:MAG TPA: PfkB family carbohydrate kinase [Terriglobia bacterium]|nr:PfkB family carbohydrate kinase [Terriglobia bacterium]